MHTTTEQTRQPFCLYRLPAEADTWLCSGPTVNLHKHPDAEGFHFSSFDEKEAWSIKPEIHRKAEAKSLSLPFFYKEENEIASTRDAYITTLNTAIYAINDHRFDKVVLSRFKQLTLPTDFDILSFFDTICRAYPDAFVYLLSTPQSGTWLGASPELLLKKRGNVIETMSLAGTRNGLDKLAQAFGSKEIEEQALVTNYIEEKLSHWVDELEVTGPVEKKAGSLTHLATYFRAKLKEGVSLSNILHDMHPTPAVCGVPKEEAMNFIKAHEKYERELYTGYLGFVSTTNADIFVNLRCMQLTKNYTRLFAGGGIVKGSDPQSEWEETEAKMQTIGRFLS
jgi:isochorismate synthase